MSDGHLTGFERRRLPGFGIEVDVLVGGTGPPVLLLHGYPQTRLAWKAVAPLLVDRFTLVIPDLRGYGRSNKPEGDENHERYSKRVMALDQIETMRALGYAHFAVAGHDRGARITYRMALDHPHVVTRLALLDIVPTCDMWANANAASAMKSFHWYFLAQPRPLPEQLIGNASDFYLRTILKSWAGHGFSFDPESLQDYGASFSDPACIHATCEDYRAGWTCDRQYDEADRGRKITAPMLVLWGEQYGIGKADPLAIWSKWAEDVRGQSLPCGHFLCEEAPHATAEALGEFFSGGT
jgi:haloacetate dehalogenase